MITLTDVHKRYRGHHSSHWILRGVTLQIPMHESVALIGCNGAGKSTLLRLIGGTDEPNRGTVRRTCRVSWPLGLQGNFQGSLSGRQNTKFVCRIHGTNDAMQDRLEFVKAFSELGEAYDDAVNTYSSGMRARLAFAMSMAFDFDMYLVDELTAVGDAAFKRKSQKAFEDRAGRAGLVMVSHSEATLRTFCRSAIWLHEGTVRCFGTVDEALACYKESIAT
ncbi:MAG TPA: ABC transporter ATP-binding protein [Burkholderiales bacterium]|jgi:capsular polysaccharide transport system ATP-binding protein|nr:ABC transporter ATP-binding protein [Burkholderiales bacterium]